MMSTGRTQISGKGQIFKAGEFLCNVTFTYIQIGNPEGGSVRREGELLIEVGKRKSPEVITGIRHIPLELHFEDGKKMQIIVPKVVGNLFDGTYLFVPWETGHSSD
jgi:hypothetical protein